MAGEVVSREGLAEKVDFAEAYEILSRTTADNQQAVAYLAKAREAALKQGKSPAPYLLTELSLQLSRQNAPECQRLMNEIRSKHMKEPGIGQMLFEMLVQHGIIGPDGQPVGPPPGEAPAAAAGDQSSSPKSELWTPDGGSSEAGGETTQKLWVPGMD